MRDVKQVLGVALEGVEPPAPQFDQILRRVSAHWRRERLLAAGLALVLTAGLAVGLAAALARSGPPAPATAGSIVGPTRVVQIPSTSMEPTLRPGDQVLVDEGAYRSRLPRRGDVIAFTIADRDISPPGLSWVKRVIGLPGDVVTERRGALFVNGERITLPSRGVAADHRTLGPWKVPAGRLFVVGDNLANSNDSRYALGYVPLKGVIGQVVWILSPDERIGGLRPPHSAVMGPMPSASPR
jgi:signal peptidase I